MIISADKKIPLEKTIKKTMMVTIGFLIENSVNLSNGFIILY